MATSESPKRGPEDAPSITPDQLSRAELRLKRVGWWVSVASIVSAVAAFGTTYSALKLSEAQHALTTAQAIEQVQKEQVSFEFKVTPLLLPDGKHMYFKTTLKNRSVKEVNVFIVNLRAWRMEGWHDTNDEYDAPLEKGKTLISDVLIADCPPNFCPENAPPVTPDKTLRLRKLTDTPLEAAEEMENTFGPYQINTAHAKLGIWVEGIVYVYETGDGKCALDPSQDPPDPGNVPTLCEQLTPGKCEKSGCIAGAAPPEFYRLILDHDGPAFRRVISQ